MVGKNATVRVAIVGDNSSLDRSLKQSQTGVAKFGKAIAKAGLLIGGAAAVGLFKLAEGAAEDAKAQATLARQLENTTKATKGQVKQVEAWITVQGKVLGVADDDLRPALGRLVTATGDIDKAQRLAALAMDVSAGSGKSLQTVTEALVKAENGSLGGLSRLGVKTKDAAGNTKTLAAVTTDLRHRFDDAAKSAAGTAAGKYQRLKVQLSELGESIGARLLPVAGELADWLIQHQDDIDRWGKKAGDAAAEVGDLGKQVGEVLWPALKDIGKVLGDVLGWFNDLPTPVKKVSIEVVIAALAFGKLTGALTKVRAELVATRGEATLAQAGIAQMSQAAKFAAGAGGLLLLTTSLQGAADEGASFSEVMTGTVGGAMTGLAVGGPIGALVGAAAGGGLTALIGAFSDTEGEARAARLELLKTEGFKQAKQDAEALRESLVGVIHMYGEVPRAAVKASFFGEDGKLDADIQLLRDAGVSMDTLVSATMGQRDAGKLALAAMDAAMSGVVDNAVTAQSAWQNVKDGVIEYRNAQGVLVTQHVSTEDQDKIEQAWHDASDALAAMGVNQDTFYKRIQRNTGAIADHQKAMRQLADTLGVTVAQFEKWPKDVRTKFEAEGLPQTASDALRLINRYKGLQSFKRIRAVVSAPGVDLTRQQIQNLQKRYKLNPRQVKTLIKLEGVKAAEADARRVKDGLEDTAKAPGKLERFVADLRADAKRGGAVAEAGAADVSKRLRDGTRKARAELGPFQTSLKNGTDTAKATASTGGQGIGAALKSGALVGMFGLGPALSAMMTAAVNQTIAAGRAAAQAKSPSKKTEKLGLDLARGLVVGVTKGSSGVQAAITKLVGDLTKTLDHQLAARQKAIRKRLSGKAEAAALKAQQKRWKDHVRAVKKSLADEIAALKANGKAQDLLRQQLGERAPKQTARDALAEIVDEAKAFRDSMKSAAVDFASVVNLDVGFNPKVMQAEMQHRLDKIRWFTSVLDDLAKKGLSKDIISQLAQAGVEGGLATALAIQHGGQTAVDEFTKLQNQINAAAGTLAGNVTDQLYAAQIAKAEAHVKQLEARVEKLEARARRLLERLAKAMQKAEMGGGGGGGAKPRLAFDPARITPPGSATAPTPKMTQPTTPVPAPVHNTFQITVHAPVGASPAEIGRTITRYIDAYEKSGGRRRT